MGNDDPREAEGAEREERLLPLAFVGGLVVGAVVLGLVWMTVSMTGGDGASAGISDTSGVAGFGDSPKGGPSVRPDRPSGPSRLERCQRAATRLRAPLAAAGPAMDQWELHIGAMNKLVVGAITLDQATAFWNQTRLGAERRIAAFDRGVAGYERHRSPCPTPGALTHASHALRGCVREVAADRAELDAARTAVTMWRKHVHDMDRLRLGTLSPSDAEQMWLTMWQRGVHELQRYRAAERAAKHSHGCLGPVLTGGTGQMPGM